MRLPSPECDVCDRPLPPDAPWQQRRHPGECHREHERRRRGAGYREGRHARPAPRGPWSGTRTCRYCAQDFAAKSPRSSVCYTDTCQRRRHADHLRPAVARRRAMRAAAPAEPFTRGGLLASWEERGHYGCAYCGGPYAHDDHAIPLSRGGAHAVGNLVPACEHCNLSKGVRTPAEFLAR